MAPRPQSPSNRKWDAKAEELEFTALERVKTTAEKWLTSIASLTGIFGIVALIKGPEDVSELTLPWRVAVGVALLIAVTCAFAAIYLGALAAQGIPNNVWGNGQIVRIKSRVAAEKAAQWLSVSRLLVIPAVLALTTAIGFTWFGDRPTGSPSSTTVLIVQKSGAVRCGELAVDQQGNTLLKVKDASLIPVNDVISMSVINKCP